MALKDANPAPATAARPVGSAVLTAARLGRTVDQSPTDAAGWWESLDLSELVTWSDGVAGSGSPESSRGCWAAADARDARRAAEESLLELVGT